MTPYLNSIEFVYTQEPDDNDDDGEQELRVSVETAGAGPYLILQTKRWSFDQPHNLEQLLQKIETAVFPLFAPYPETESE